MVMSKEEKQANAKAKIELRLRSAVRTIKLRVGDIDGDAKEVLARWQAASEAVTTAANVLYQQWLAWHVVNRSGDKIRVDNDHYIKWNNADKKTRGKAPKSRVECFPKKLMQTINTEIGIAVPGLNAQSKAELMQRHIKDFMTHAASKGMGKAWKDVLLCRQAMPSFTRQLPTPLKACAIEIYRDSDDDKKPWKMCLRVDRFDTATKAGGIRSSSHEDHFAFHVKKSDGMTWSVLRGVVSGDMRMMGSALRYDDRKRQWYVCLCYQRPKNTQPDLDVEKKAILCPDTKHPWLLRMNGRTGFPASGGNDIKHVRRLVMSQRAGRKHNYRYAGSARKGHGDKQANKPLWKLSQRWKEFTRRHNHVSASRIVGWCCSRRIGTLIYCKPDDRRAKTCRLATAGKSGSYRENSSWEWLQFANYLRQKCDDRGVKLIIRERSSNAETLEGEAA